MLAAVREINDRYGTSDWEPIVLIHENIHAELLAAIYRAADLCLVSSLQDGMNLVAKEFVACQVDEHGVLVLSRFTGAAEEIDEALLINPFNVGGFADGIRAALEMEHAERRRRMRAMRAQLHRSTIFDWLEAILARCADLMDLGTVTDVDRQSRGRAPNGDSFGDNGPNVNVTAMETDRPGETCANDPSACLQPVTRHCTGRVVRHRAPGRAVRLLLLLDVDGTLAPIAPHPALARIPDETRRSIASLAANPNVVVVLVSGRAAHDARRLVGVEGVWTIGNHGAEVMDPDGEVAVDEIGCSLCGFDRADAQTFSTPLLAPLKGVVLENKTWTLSVHYPGGGRSDRTAHFE